MELFDKPIISAFLRTAGSLLKDLGVGRPPAVRSGQYRDMTKMLAALHALPGTPYVPLKPNEFQPQEGTEIGMNCAGITDAQSRHPILGTFGLVTCMGLAVYNTATKTGGLTHLAQASDDPLILAPDSATALRKLLQAVRPEGKDWLEVRLMGPGYYAGHFMPGVLNILNETPRLRILSADLGGKPFVSAFGMDTRRWSEGLIKGKNSSGLSMADDFSAPGNMERFRAGMKHIADIESLPPARNLVNGLYDERFAAASPAPRPAPTPR